MKCRTTVVVAAGIVILFTHSIPLHAQPVGKSRLFVEMKIDQKPAEDQKLSPELEALVKSDGVLAGITTKGVVVIDVPAPTVSAASTQIKTLKEAPKVFENAANAGKLNPVTRLMVKYKRGENPPSKSLEDAGLKVIRHSEPGAFLLVESKKEISADLVKKIQGVEAISYIQPDKILSIPKQIRSGKVEEVVSGKSVASAAAPKKDEPSTLEPLDRFYVDGTLFGLKNADCPKAWKSTTSSKKIVAVIDTGVDYTHRDLRANIWVNEKEASGQPGVDDDGNGSVDDIHGYDYLNNDGDPMDDNDHGTHCAGTIGAVADADGVVGVAWKVKIMPLKFLSESGSGSNADAIFCIDYAIKNGAHIISASWGGYGRDNLLEEAIGRAEAAGVLFVAAAGNDANNNDGAAVHYPSSYPNENVIAVMSIDKNDKVSGFSNFGKTTVDLAAPGSEIMSSVRGGGYESFSGTSMATPHVAGAIALTWDHSRYVGLSAKQVKKLILDSGRPLAPLTGKCVTGKTLNLAFLAP